MSHFTQISATLINEKYYKGYSQAVKGKIKATGMQRVGKMGRALCMCMLVCWHVGTCECEQKTGGRWKG